MPKPFDEKATIVDQCVMCGKHISLCGCAFRRDPAIGSKPDHVEPECWRAAIQGIAHFWALGELRPNYFDLLSKSFGWLPLRVGHAMRITNDGKVYEVRRLK